VFRWRGRSSAAGHPVGCPADVDRRGHPAQRRSIEALKAELSSFDEQLAALEQILGPLAQWSTTWAELEQRLLNLGRSPQGQGPASGSP